MKTHPSQHNTPLRYPDLTEVLKPCEHKWVALSPDYSRVIASGDTLQETLSRVDEQDRQTVIFHKVIPPEFAPTAYAL